MADMEARDLQVPDYFICPISLQIMTDPVTLATGITYDRPSIQKWLLSHTTCPVTKLPLPSGSDLTPNHILHRFIQCWSASNFVPTPKPSHHKPHLLKLLADFSHPSSQMTALRNLELLAAENQQNRELMRESRVPKFVLSYVLSRFGQGRSIDGLEEALSLLHFLRFPDKSLRRRPNDDRIIEALSWVLGCHFLNNFGVKSNAIVILRRVLEADAGTASLLETLNPEFFGRLIGLLRDGAVSQSAINSALRILLDACPWGRNRMMMIRSGAVFNLVELELTSPEKKTTELVLGILYHLCCCAEGRAEFVSHKGGVAVVTKRILEVSAAATELAILVLASVSKLKVVGEEMMEAGAVAKLCVILQMDYAAYLKEKASDILRSYYDEWINSPCIHKPVEVVITNFEAIMKIHEDMREI